MVAATAALALAGLSGIMPMRFADAGVELSGVSVPWFVPVLALALLATALAYLAGIAAVRRLGSKVASFLGLTEVLASIVVAWLLLGEMPLPVQLVGGLLIIGGVVAVRYDELTHGALAAEPAGEVDGDADVPTSDPVPTAAA
jgi:drug/metabolite transporter (DMT)-like permease